MSRASTPVIDPVELTRDLIRIPTLNPPGRNYREICDYLAGRLGPQGFAVELLRAEGSPGDCAEFPRWNLVARRDGARPRRQPSPAIGFARQKPESHRQADQPLGQLRPDLRGPTSNAALTGQVAQWSSV